MRAAEYPGSDRGAPGRAGTRSSAECTQGELHHVAVIHRNAAAIGVTCNVAQGQNETVVDVSGADLGLGDRVVMNVISRCPKQHPVWIELQARTAENALSAVEKPDQRLRGIAAVHHGRGPAAEIRGRFEVWEVEREGALGEAE